jgi:hypothetical protein
MDFFGISNYLKAYKLYNPNTKKLLLMKLNFELEVIMVLKKNIIVDLDGDNKKKKQKEGKIYKGCTMHD